MGMARGTRFLDSLLSCRMPSSIRRGIVSLRAARNEVIAKRVGNKWMESVRGCNICGWYGKEFGSFYNEIMSQDEEVICPNCRSEPRQRALFKYLQEEFLSNYIYIIRERNFLCLEVSPDPSNPVEKALKGISYTSIDLDESRAMFQMDLTDLTFKNGTFDMVVCSHVLEHIEDDVAAIKQIHRVLRDGGTALIQVPIGYYDDPDGKSTVEFGERRFYGHFRTYGYDFSDKLMRAGFRVDVVRFANDDASSRLAMGNEAIFKCRK